MRTGSGYSDFGMIGSAWLQERIEPGLHGYAFERTSYAGRRLRQSRIA
jgi:hypothetical protein